MKLPLIIATISACQVIFLSGCATIIKGTTQTVPVSSEPTGARVLVDGQPEGTTPTKVDLKRKQNHLVVVEMDGYESESVAITHSVGGAVWGNAIAGGLVGWGVDASTGAEYNLRPETVSVRLRPKVVGQVAIDSGQSKTKQFIDELNGLDGLLEAKKITPDEYQKMRAALVAKYGQ